MKNIRSLRNRFWVFRSFSSALRAVQCRSHAASTVSSLSPCAPQTLFVRSFASKYPEHIVLSMPALSPTMEKGNLATWKKKVGDVVKAGDAIAEVETDKATVAFESVESGYIAKILIPEGSQDVTVGKPVAILVENQSDIDAFKDYTAEAPAAPKTSSQTATPPPAPVSTASPTTPLSSSSSSLGRVVASPLARKLASESGIDLSQIKGTGPNDRIVAADVKEFSVARPAAAATPVASAPAPSAPSVPTFVPSGSFEEIPHTQVRKIIASRLSQSKQQIPHYYLTVDVNVDKLLQLRSQLNAKAEKEAKASKTEATKLSVNDFIIKASALALRKVPMVNASWMENAIRQYNYVDISVAVSTETGLVTPIVKDADLKGLASISSDVKNLAAKARANKLQPHEFQGGTFTISNLGMYGIKQFAAIINPPQSCILAVGSADQRVVLGPVGEDGKPTISSSQVVTVTLSCDHRVVDGALGAQWLQAFKGYVEEPLTMLL